MTSENIFGQRIFELRKSAGMTQKQLGESVGLSMQAINDIEKGRRETTITKAILMARLFNTTVEYIMGETDDSSRPDESPFIEQIFVREEIFCLAKRLKELRNKKGLSIQEVGKATHFGTLRYKNLENANTNPPLTWLIALADYFDVSLDYLVGRSDEPERR
ncbi:MAG: helix-turn-helix transcriptional regulator [Clostridiales bacterium]|nr:helix-turn-helix transcriptional regulator [Clostridiales bacterium]